MIRSLTITLAVLLMSGTAGAYNHKALNAQSLPYTAVTGDSITIDGNSAVSTKLTTAGSFINITGTTSHVFINLQNDTCIYDTDSNSTSASPNYFIKIGASAGDAPNDIIITGDTNSAGVGLGYIGTTILAGHGLGNTGGASTSPISRKTIWIYRGHTITVKQITATADGHDTHVVEFGVIGGGNVSYNVLFERDSLIDYCESYQDRQSYGGACIYTDNSTEGSLGEYSLRVRHCYIKSNGHCGIAFKTGRLWADTNTIIVDAKNTFWDTTACHPNCAVGQSAANAYCILHRYAGNSSRYVGNTFTSGNNHIGSRGLLIDFWTENAEADDSLHIIGNTFDMHEGPHGEAGPNGETRTIRIRGKEGAAAAGVDITTILITGNDVTATVDSNSSTGYIGNDGVCLHASTYVKDSNTIIVRNNTFRVKALSKDASLNAEPLFIAGETPVNGRGFYFYNNKFIGSKAILRLADASTNQDGISGARFDGDTVVYSDTIAAPTLEIIGSPPYTYNLNIASNTSTGNIVKNLTYQTISGYTNQASDTNILFTGTGAANISIVRTVTMTVLGNNGYPVPSAAARVYHSYDINGPTAIYSGTTDANGKFIPDVKYWYEANTTTDSTTFNPFRFVAVSGADSASTDYTVSPTNIAVTVTLTGTAGTPPAGAVKSFKGATMKGTKVGGP